MTNDEIELCLKNIRENTQKFREMCSSEIETSKNDFQSAEKVLMEKFIEVLNKELQLRVDKGVLFDKDIKGRAGETLDINLTDWPELKAYRKLISDDAFHDTLSYYLHNSLERYGIKKEDLFGIHVTSDEYRFSCKIRYILIEYKEPYPGKMNFYC